MSDRTANILLVEDDSMDVISVQRALSKHNIRHRLNIARNGKEGLEFLKMEATKGPDQLPDVILLDINMPKMNGIEFLEEIRADHMLKNLKVFIMTTSDQEAEKRAAGKLGVSGYIVKPLNLDNFNNSSTPIDNFLLLMDLINLNK